MGQEAVNCGYPGSFLHYHDAAAALLRDGQLVAAAEEERFTRKKHDYDFPKHAIEFCLDSAGIKGPDLDYVVFFEKPFRKLDRILATVLQTYPKSWKVFRELMITSILDKLWIASTLEAELGVRKDRVLFSEHHLSHAASAFLCSPFDEAAILTVDGVGESVTAATGEGQGSNIKLTQQIDFPHSIGLLPVPYGLPGLRSQRGRVQGDGHGALRPAAYVDKVWKLVRRTRTVRSRSTWSTSASTTSHRPDLQRAVFELFGEPRHPKTLFFSSLRLPEVLW